MYIQAGCRCISTAQVIKDYAATFYRAGLAPAANLHLSLDAAAGDVPLLRPEVAAIQGPPPAERGLPHREERLAPAGEVWWLAFPFTVQHVHRQIQAGLLFDMASQPLQACILNKDRAVCQRSPQEGTPQNVSHAAAANHSVRTNGSGQQATDRGSGGGPGVPKWLKVGTK